MYAPSVKKVPCVFVTSFCAFNVSPFQTSTNRLFSPLSPDTSRRTARSEPVGDTYDTEASPASVAGVAKYGAAAVTNFTNVLLVLREWSVTEVVTRTIGGSFAASSVNEACLDREACDYLPMFLDPAGSLVIFTNSAFVYTGISASSQYRFALDPPLLP